MRDAALIGFFFLVPLAVALESVVTLDPYASLNNANEAPKVESRGRSQWELVPARLEAKYYERIGFRNFLTRLHNSVYYRAFQASPLDDVTVGRDGWLFYHPKGLDNVFDSKACPDDQGVAKRAELFARWHRWFRDEGVPYAVAVVPSKTVACPEQLPPRLDGAPLCPAFANLVRRIEQRHDVPVIDLAEPIAQAREGFCQPLFGPSDTHWRCPAAYIGYREIMRWLSGHDPRFSPLERREVEGGAYDEGDLAEMLLLHGMLPQHEGKCVAIDSAISAERESDSPLTTIVSRNRDTSLPRLFLFGDSTIAGPLYLLAEHFSHARFVRKENFDPDSVERFAPDFVLHLIGQRMLFTEDVFPDTPPEDALEQVHRHAPTLFTLSDEAPELVHDIRFDSSADGVHLAVTGKDPYLVFQGIQARGGERVTVRVEVETERDTVLELFYAHNGELFDPNRSIRRRIKAGTQVEYFEIPGSQHLTLRLDVAKTVGAVTLSSFEVAGRPPATEQARAR